MRGSRVSSELVDKIHLLRKHGYSLDEISREVGIPKTSVFRYINGIKVLPEYLDNWAGKRGGSRKRMLLQERKAYDDAKTKIGVISKKEVMLFISALYWAEGSKKDFGLSNTDPELIRLFVNGLRNIFHISNDRLRISVRIYEDLNKEKCITYWSKVVGVPKDKFVNVNVLKGNKHGKLEYGMCRVRVARGADLLKQIAGVNKVMITSMSS